MVSDSIPHASIAMASSNGNCFPKKKRGNRSAKLRQCKDVARREQFLSHVKNKSGCKEEQNGEIGTLGSQMPTEKLEIKPRIEEGIFGNDSSMHQYSDCELSPSITPTSHCSSSILGSNDSVANFTSSSSRSRSRSSSSSNFCFSASMSDEDEGNIDDDHNHNDDYCFDDWEAMADALLASEENQQKHNSNSENLYGKAQAWKPDDVFRPQSLPNLKHFEQEGSVWGNKNASSVPTSCPICYEDLDCTDSSFLPCLCGFRLCLFCHKRILEEDGRCPGCRKQYLL